MVTTRSTKSCQRVVESSVGGATDFENGIKVGNANGVVRSKKSCKKEDRADLQEGEQGKAAPLMMKSEGGSVVYNSVAGAPEKAEPSQTRNVKRLARNSKPSQNSGSGLIDDKKSLNLSNSHSDCDTMKSSSLQVHALASDECQIDHKLVPNSLDQSLESGRKTRLARRSNTESNVSDKDEGNLGEPQKAKPKHRKQRIKRADLVAEDSLSRFRRLVKHSFSRMKMEQNLIEAYSGEGWKGLSREKIRPEKELQRAEAQILKSKFAIREAIHDLCLKCLEGSIQDSAFDSEGQIPVDEIFCAKCSSPEEYPNNDIILCDGACNRAFHQYCLEPPLAAHDIPPDDEGWLCPVCDCKLDCLDLINDFMEEDFELETSWEQIFPEADPTTHPSSEAPGDWPSDDSEDDDFDPDQLDPRKAKTEDDDQLDSVGSSSCSTSSSDSSGSKEQSEPNSEDDDSNTSGDKRKPVCSAQRKREDITASDGDDHENDVVPEKRHRIEVNYKKLNDVSIF
ncbi:hypothetical protein O6H91_05G123500 [Diphasiastrum complanatum]|uniref:Uncharacterized protein n=1 Tax=Diphasiastrum complanatum TaxID=34168 RepID=A0ACC2DT06_DIPCM|nr:hypothetical protein O6H91_05G123500 [Diphasiastrum complanatum]